MTQPEIIERLSRLPEGGIITNTNRFDVGYMGSLLDTYRIKAIIASYNGDKSTGRNKRINPQCLQKYYPLYEADLQSNELGYVLFRCPEVASISSNMDGHQYIGSRDSSCDFRRIVSRGQLATLNKHKITNVYNGTGMSVLFDAGMLEVYGNKMVREIMTESIFTQPLLLPTYNVAKDNYPISEDLIPAIESMILRDQTLLESKTPLPSEYNQQIK